MKFSDKFVAATENYSTVKEHLANPLMRRSFTLDRLPAQSEITVCGQGYYQLFVNGQDITKGYMAPYRANPNHYLYYDNYNLAPYLKVGENVIGLLLGNGFLNPDQTTWDFKKVAWRSAPKAALCVEADGEILFEADSFKCCESAITFEEFHAGEHYDARLEHPGWNDVDYDDSAWRPVISASRPKGEARVPDCEPIGIIAVHYPARIIKTSYGSYIYDFAVNCAGLCRLDVKGSRGQEVTMTYGEVIENGKVDVNNISFGANTEQGYIQCDKYVLKGEGQESYMPHFTYHGFRYVEVSGITEKQATPSLLTFYEMSSSFSQTGDFYCDNAEVNAVFDCTKRSNRANFMYFPTDCPQREKNGWTGDAALSCDQFLLLYDCSRSLKEWLRNIFKAQHDDGAVPGIIPTDTWGYEWGCGPAWDNVIFELPYRIYLYTGDDEIIREGAEHMFKYLCYMETKRDERGLYHFGLQDWCPPYTDRSLNTDLTYTDTIICKDMCDKAAFMFELIGKTDYARKAAELSSDIKDSFRKHCMNNGVTLCHTQTAQAMAIFYGMVNENEEKNAMDALLYLIDETNDHFTCGVIGNRVIFRLLAQKGHADLAMKMLFNPTGPSFATMLKSGATSLWENLTLHHGNVSKDLNRGALRLYSLNHHFWGDVSAFFISHLGGIKVKSFDNVEISPSFVQGINNLDTEIGLPAGKVRVCYKRTDVMTELSVSIPKNLRAEFVLPKGYVLSRGSKNLKPGVNELIICNISDEA